MNNILKKISLISLFSINVIFGMESKTPTIKKEDLKEKYAQQTRILNVLKTFPQLDMVSNYISPEEINENSKQKKTYATVFTGLTFGKANDSSINNDIEFIRQVEKIIENNLFVELQQGKNINILLIGAGKMSLTVAYMLYKLKDFKEKNKNTPIINIFYNDAHTSFHTVFIERLKTNNLEHKDINIIPVICDMFQLHKNPLISGIEFNIALEENSVHFFNERKTEEFALKEYHKNNPTSEQFTREHDEYIKNVSLSNFVINIYNMLKENSPMIMKSRTIATILNENFIKPQQTNNNASDNILKAIEKKNKKTKEKFYKEIDKCIAIAFQKSNNDEQSNTLNELLFSLISKIDPKEKNELLSYTNIIPGDFFNKKGKVLDILLNENTSPEITINYICEKFQALSSMKEYNLKLLKEKNEVNFEEKLLEQLNEHPINTIFKTPCKDFKLFFLSYQASRLSELALTEIQCIIIIRKQK